MNPVPEACESRPVPFDFAPFEAAAQGRPRPVRSPAFLSIGTAMRGDELDIGMLVRFKSMMAVEGQGVDLPRLCHDRLYAYERIAIAHTSRDDALRGLALALFQVYHRRESAGRPAQ